MSEYPHLELFGGVCWVQRGERHLAPPGRPTVLLIHLADAAPATVSVERLVDVLWPDAVPASGRNALQRHVSRVRTWFRRDVGANVDPIESTASGYRLGRGITTDFGLIDARASSDPATDTPPRWWMEPIPGAAWDGMELIRSRLIRGAVGLGESWSDGARSKGRHLEAARMLERLAEANRFHLDLWRSAADATAASGDLPAMVALAERLAGLAASNSWPELAGVAADLRAKAVRRTPAVALEGPISEWLMGDVERALRSIRSAGVPDDLRHRVARWTDVYAPSDGWARQLMNDLLMSETWADRQAERIIVALDGVAQGQRRTVEPYQAGEARTLAELRALRVAWFSRLGLPTTATADAIVQDLQQLDPPDARVEAARFALVNDVRRGRWAQAIAGLHTYERVVAEEWPAEYDHFVPLSYHIMSLHPLLAEFGLGELVRTRFPRMSSDRLAAELAEVMQVLRHGSNVSASIRPAVDMAAATLMHDAKIGLQLMADRAVGDADAAVARLAAIRTVDDLGLPHHHRHLLDVGAAEASVWLEDRRVAELCRRALEPFADEQLGLWPIDGLFGSANSLLEQLDAVR